MSIVEKQLCWKLNQTAILVTKDHNFQFLSLNKCTNTLFKEIMIFRLNSFFKESKEVEKSHEYSFLLIMQFEFLGTIGMCDATKKNWLRSRAAF